MAKKNRRVILYSAMAVVVLIGALAGYLLLWPSNLPHYPTCPRNQGPRRSRRRDQDRTAERIAGRDRPSDKTNRRIWIRVRDQRRYLGAQVTAATNHERIGTGLGFARDQVTARSWLTALTGIHAPPYQGRRREFIRPNDSV